MLKYIKNHLATIENVEIFPVISLIIFSVFFMAVIWYVFSINKAKIQEIESIPLNDN